MLKIGIIGTGQISSQFAKTCHANDQVKVLCVYSRNQNTAENFAKENNIELAISNMKEFLNSEIDAVYIASPNSIHYAQAKEALLADKHVLVEKPISSYKERTEELFDLAKKRNLIIHEAILTVPSDSYQFAKSNLGKLGEINGFDFHLMKQTRHYQSYVDGAYINVFDEKMEGGAINDLGIYCIYPVVDFFGLPDKLNLDWQKSRDNADLGALINLEYTNFNGIIRVSKIVSNENQSVIYGTNASMYINSINHFEKITIKYNDGRKEEYVRSNEILMEPELDYFVAKISQSCTNEYVERQLTLNVAKILDELRRLK